MGERVFVYGTLRRGARNGSLMAGAEWLGSASVNGWLYRLGWYPGLILDPHGPEVRGDLFEIRSERLLADLDAYEGCAPDQPEPREFQRVRTMVAGPGGPVEAWLWVWQPAPGAPLPEPLGGDWLAR